MPEVRKLFSEGHLILDMIQTTKISSQNLFLPKY